MRRSRRTSPLPAVTPCSNTSTQASYCRFRRRKRRRTQTGASAAHACVWLVQAMAFPRLSASSCTLLNSRRIRQRTACATNGPMGSLFASVAGLRSFEADLQVALSTELMVRASLACTSRMGWRWQSRSSGRAMEGWSRACRGMCARALSSARVWLQLSVKWQGSEELDLSELSTYLKDSFESVLYQTATRLHEESKYPESIEIALAMKVRHL